MRRLSSRWVVGVLGVLCFSWSYWAMSQPKKPPKRGTKRVKTVPRLGKKIWSSCEKCHVTDSWKKIKQNSGFDHSLTGFPLHGKHKQTTCNRCHNTSTKKNAQGRPSHFAAQAKRIRSCRNCHQSPHKNTVSRDCRSCHNTLTWKRNRLFARHQRTQFPLTGAHASTPCKSCHVNKEQQGYRKLPLACNSCHSKDFARPTNHPNHVTSGFSRSCQRCHATYSWKPAQVNHTLFFPLIGAHNTTPCKSCHINNRYKGTPRDCFSCHQKDYTRAKHTAASFSKTCTQCHGQTAWKPAKFPNHKFPLAGNHNVPCNQCHTNTTSYKVFNCLAPCHKKGDTDGEHGDVTGYVYESRKCYSCHPQGN